jgi:O-antigen/teichoic acid export membrane protein
VVVICLAANLPLGVVRHVHQGLQEGFVNSLWESAGRVLGLAGLLLMIRLQAGLAWLALTLAGAVSLALLLNSLELFAYRRPWLRPRWGNYHRASAKKLLHTGLFFFLLQMGVTLIYTSDNLIIAHFLGPAAVTQYAIPYQMFSIALLIFNAIFWPLWPAYSEAMARGDLAWVQKTLHRSLIMILLSIGLVSLFLVVFGNQLLLYWVGSKISPSLSLNIGLGLWMVVLTFGSALSLLLNAANIFRFQIMLIFLTVTVSLIMKSVLVQYYGIPGIIWSTIIAYAIIYIVPSYSYINKKFYV